MFLPSLNEAPSSKPRINQQKYQGRQFRRNGNNAILISNKGLGTHKYSINYHWISNWFFSNNIRINLLKKDTTNWNCLSPVLGIWEGIIKYCCISLPQDHDSKEWAMGTFDDSQHVSAESIPTYLVLPSAAPTLWNEFGPERQESPVWAQNGDATRQPDNRHKVLQRLHVGRCNKKNTLSQLPWQDTGSMRRLIRRYG